MLTDSLNFHEVAVSAGTAIIATTGDRIDLVNGLGADVVVDYHEQNIDTVGNHTEYVVFNNSIFPACGNCRGRSSSLLGLCRP